MSSRRIAGVAIKLNGVLYTRPPPERHHHIIHRLAELLPTPIRGEQGFVLDDGTFVDRKAAWTIAKEAGQLIARAPTDKRGGTLYSEDVW